MDFATIASSVVSSASARLVFHPIDTLRTIKQTTGGSYHMPIHRYWSGLFPAIGLSVPGFTAYLVAYRQSKAQLSPYLGPTSLANYIVSGSVAEIASSCVWTPTEVLKGRMQIASESQTSWQLVRSIYKLEGIRGFFHGYFLGLVVFLPHSVLWWVTYERIRQYICEGDFNKLQPQHHAVSAALATANAVVWTNFLDVVKTRQQLAYSPEVARLRPSDTKGARVIALNLIKECGLFRALTIGMGMRMLSTVPSSALAMAIMETLHPDPTVAIVQED